MEYKKAFDVLPEEIIYLIQEYIDGEYLYIPRKEGSKKSWGEVSGTKEDLSKRNLEIYKRYNLGVQIRYLAEEYYLSEKTIRKIVSQQNNKNK